MELFQDAALSKMVYVVLLSNYAKFHACTTKCRIGRANYRNFISDHPKVDFQF